MDIKVKKTQHTHNTPSNYKLESKWNKEMKTVRKAKQDHPVVRDKSQQKDTELVKISLNYIGLKINEAKY